MSCNKGGVAARIIFPLIFVNLNKSYSGIFFCVDFLNHFIYWSHICCRKFREKMNLFSGLKWQPAGYVIIINDIHTKLQADKSFVEHLQNKWTNKKLY